MTRFTTAMVAGALIAATALPGATSSSAQLKREADSRGDVERVTENPDGTTDRVDRPRHRDGDIVSVRATHGDRRVYVVVRYADLIRRADMQLRAPVRAFKGGEARQYQIRSANGTSDDRLNRPLLLVGNNPADMSDTGCRAVEASVDFAADVWRASVSRSCLGRPYSVVVATQYFRQLSFDVDTETYLWDRHRVNVRLHRGQQR